MHALQQQALSHSSLMVVIGLGFMACKLFRLCAIECLQSCLQIHAVPLGFVLVLVGLIQGDLDVSKSFHESA